MTMRSSMWTGLMSMGAAVLPLLALRYPALGPFIWPAVVVMIMVIVRYGVLDFLLRSHVPEAMSAGAMWRIAVVAVISILALPVIFVVLATSGGSRSAVLAVLSTHTVAHGWDARALDLAALLEAVCLLGIPVLVVIGPEYLRTRGRAAAASSLVPAWLAGFASVLTAVYIVLLHFVEPRNAGLGKSPWGVWSVAAFGVAVLLAPLYRIVARECLQRGLTVVFDPGRWWSAWCGAFREMRSTPAVTAEAGEQAPAQHVPDWWTARKS